MNLLILLIIPSVISFILFPVVIKFAFKYGFTDDPSKSKHPAKLHLKILPRMGGIAPFIAILLTILIFIPLDKHLTGMLIASLILLLINTLGVLEILYIYVFSKMKSKTREGKYKN